MAMRLGAFAKSLAITGTVAAGFYFAVGPGTNDHGLVAHEASANDEHPAVVYRQGLMQMNRWHISRLGAMAKGEIEFDAAKAVHHAKVISVLATAIPEGFPEGSDTDDADVLPNIWEDFSAFEEAAGNLHTAAAALAEAEDVSADSLGGYVKEIGGACGACHKKFRPES